MSKKDKEKKAKEEDKTSKLLVESVQKAATRKGGAMQRSNYD